MSRLQGLTKGKGTPMKRITMLLLTALMLVFGIGGGLR